MAFRPEDWPDAAKMYRSGSTMKQVAQLYNTNERTISRAFHALRIEFHSQDFWGRRQRKFSHEKAIESYRSGKSLSAVAAECGVCPKAILLVLRKHDIPTRPQGAPRRDRQHDFPLLRALVLRGLPRRKICDLTGRSTHSIARLEGSLGAPPRNSPRYQAWVAKLAREAA